MHEYYGGRNTYGEGIGIIMTNKIKARPPGDVGNATTFNFPVRYYVVEEMVGYRHRMNDRSLLEPMLKAVRELEAAGVLGITTTCGFLSTFQRELSAAVSIPVFTSSLMLLPLIYEMYSRSGKVGIITANQPDLKPEFFEAVGAEKVPVVLAGMQDQPGFRGSVTEDVPVLDFDQITEEATGVARRLVAENPDVRAILLECANLPPYARAIQLATGLPVFDFVTLTNMVYDAVRAESYPLVDLKWGKAWWRSRW